MALTTDERVRRILQDNPDGIRLTEITKQVMRDPQQVLRCLNDMKENEEVVKDETTNLWRLLKAFESPPPKEEGNGAAEVKDPSPPPTPTEKKRNRRSPREMVLDAFGEYDKMQDKLDRIREILDEL